jgi:hypothetical protein
MASVLLVARHAQAKESNIDYCWRGVKPSVCPPAGFSQASAGGLPKANTAPVAYSSCTPDFTARHFCTRRNFSRLLLFNTIESSW